MRRERALSEAQGRALRRIARETIQRPLQGISEPILAGLLRRGLVRSLGELRPFQITEAGARALESGGYPA